MEIFPRTNNSYVDALATLALTIDSNCKRTIKVEYLPKPSIKIEHNQVMCVDLESSWMDPTIAYLKRGTLPKDSR